MQSLYDGANIIVLDLETANSAADLATGWNDKAALGISVGCYYDCLERMVVWFDRASLFETVEFLVGRQPLMISFNGIGFDFALMRALLRREDGVGDDEIHDLCDDFKALTAGSYDILAAIWQADPQGKFERGLNSLDAILAANGLPAKSGDGAQAPKDWAAGRYAQVLNYCQRDVELTLRLAERVTDTGGHLRRRDGRSVAMPYLAIEGGQGCIVPPLPPPAPSEAVLMWGDVTREETA